MLSMLAAVATAAAAIVALYTGNHKPNPTAPRLQKGLGLNRPGLALMFLAVFGAGLSIREARLSSNALREARWKLDAMGKQVDEAVASSKESSALQRRAQGDFAGALLRQQEALEIRQGNFPDDHPNVLLSKSNLASTRMALGDLKGARELHEAVLEAWQRIAGEDDPRTLNSMNLLADSLRAQGNLDRARRLQEQALEVRLRVLGVEHPDTLTSMNGLARTCVELGETNRALELAIQAVAGVRETWGDEHPNTKALVAFLESTRSW